MVEYNTIIEMNNRYMFMLVVLIYSSLFLYFTRNVVFERISKAILLLWAKIVSISYVFFFPLIFYIFTYPNANFDRFATIIISVYSITFIVLLGVGQMYTLEFIARATYYLTGYDLSKKLRLKKKKW